MFFVVPTADPKKNAQTVGDLPDNLFTHAHASFGDSLNDGAHGEIRLATRTDDSRLRENPFR